MYSLNRDTTFLRTETVNLEFETNFQIPDNWIKIVVDQIIV